MHNDKALISAIESFATQLLFSLITNVEEDTEQNGEAKKEDKLAADAESEEEIKRKLFLHFALCTKNQELLNR